MCVSVSSLNSGSNGNCYYIGNDNEAVLVDAGISCRETEKRMAKLALNMSRVKAIFITHEHTDHISGLPTLAHKYQLPVYITERTLASCRFSIDGDLIHSFRPYEEIIIGDLRVVAFPKSHDACDPHSFTVSSQTVRIGVFTDIGKCCREVEYHFKHCHAAFLESNYDKEMLLNGKYPYHLKKRISGGSGHLSNEQAYDLFVKFRPPYMRHLFLSHLSKENNCPELVRQLFNQHAHQTEIVIASRYEQTPLFEILPMNNFPLFSLPKRLSAQPGQLSLF